MKPTKILVVDMYHGDDFPDIDFQELWDKVIPGKDADYIVRGIIHKATEGPDMVDAKYREREKAARKVGFLWGAYHFVRPGDPAQQAQHFVGQLSDWRTDATLMALDHEDESVRLWMALRWLQLVAHITGQTPWMYAGIDKEKGRHAPTFAEFPLWLPEYGPVANVPQPWTKYALWQYTDGKAGPEPHSIPGVAHPLDISSFDGSEADLRAVWPGPKAAVVVAQAESVEGSSHELVVDPGSTSPGDGRGDQHPGSEGDDDSTGNGSADQPSDPGTTERPGALADADSGELVTAEAESTGGTNEA